ncbi:hypothetical protein [Streptomyces sp. ISL-11]|uniref:hypothetical protein n=1 Tax=Streptomyces sp. ISL-11 TaxID=2819174 RepID=UPI001BE4EA97|nr:hypothetical protein [Streptomyces sp. ISL-11]MBT2382953.1 hypothetical protein [Streptomyces sp. ISL-11]
MSQVRRGIMQALAWALATAAAMAVSWYGVRTVLAGTAYEPPRALPISGTAAPAAGRSAPSAHVPQPSASPSPPAPTAPSPQSAPPSPTSGIGTARSSETSSSPGAGEVKNYPVRGGQVVFDLGGDSAALVSATPEEGWQMRVWKQSAWIRVDFVSGTRTTSVFVTWNGHPPQVQTVES